MDRGEKKGTRLPDLLVELSCVRLLFLLMMMDDGAWGGVVHDALWVVIFLAEKGSDGQWFLDIDAFFFRGGCPTVNRSIKDDSGDDAQLDVQGSHQIALR